MELLFNKNFKKVDGRYEYYLWILPFIHFSHHFYWNRISVGFLFFSVGIEWHTKKYKKDKAEFDIINIDTK